LLLVCGLMEIISKYNRLFTKQVYHVKNKLQQIVKLFFAHTLAVVINNDILTFMLLRVLIRK